MTQEDVSGERLILRNSAFHSLFLDKINANEEIDLAEARKLIGEYNQRNRLSGGEALSIEEIMFATISGDYETGEGFIFIYGPRATLVMADLTLKDLEDSKSLLAPYGINTAREIIGIVNSVLQ